MTTPRILVFAASTRIGSFNQGLASHMALKLRATGAEVTLLDLSQFPLPIFNEDIESEGLPSQALELHTLLREHDGVFIASPEYNANATPLLINMLAWVSRVREHGGIAAAFGHSVFALGSASPGASVATAV